MILVDSLPEYYKRKYKTGHNYTQLFLNEYSTDNCKFLPYFNMADDLALLNILKTLLVKSRGDEEVSRYQKICVRKIGSENYLGEEVYYGYKVPNKLTELELAVLTQTLNPFLHIQEDEVLVRVRRNVNNRPIDTGNNYDFKTYLDEAFIFSIYKKLDYDGRVLELIEKLNTIIGERDKAMVSFELPECQNDQYNKDSFSLRVELFIPKEIRVMDLILNKDEQCNKIQNKIIPAINELHDYVKFREWDFSFCNIYHSTAIAIKL